MPNWTFDFTLNKYNLEKQHSPYSQKEVAGSEVWFKWSKARAHYLTGSGKHWPLPTRIMWECPYNSTMHINNNTLREEEEEERTLYMNNGEHIYTLLYVEEKKR